MKKCFQFIHRFIQKISLVDQFLILTMFILLIQSAFTLFVQESASQDTNAIDIITRTSAASIFGYFLSGNFMKQKPSSLSVPTQNNTAHDSQALTENKVINQIGFDLARTSSGIEVGKASIEELPANSGHCDNLQIVVISVIGIVSLVTLLVVRNFVQITPQSSATLSQLRDFISACVGFLISCGKKQ